MTWRTFLQARWPALVAADFFTTEVWTGRGLVTYYVAFLLDVQSRRIQVIGCTPYPNEAFVSSACATPPARQACCLTGDCCCAIATRGGVAPLNSGWAPLVCESCGRRPAQRVTGAVRRRQRVGGILNFYYRSAA
jgi:hypothetical protein